MQRANGGGLAQAFAAQAGRPGRASAATATAWHGPQSGCRRARTAGHRRSSRGRPRSSRAQGRPGRSAQGGQGAEHRLNILPACRLEPCRRAALGWTRWRWRAPSAACTARARHPGCMKRRRAAWPTGCRWSSCNPTWCWTGAARWAPAKRLLQAGLPAAHGTSRRGRASAAGAAQALVVQAGGAGPAGAGRRRGAGGPGPAAVVEHDAARHARPAARVRTLAAALAVGGFLMFSTLGPGTLPELRDHLPRAGLGRADGAAHRHARSGRHAGAGRLCRPGDGPGAGHADLARCRRPAGRTAHPGRQRVAATATPGCARRAGGAAAAACRSKARRAPA
jgi:hypothetical protein